MRKLDLFCGVLALATVVACGDDDDDGGSDGTIDAGLVLEPDAAPPPDGAPIPDAAPTFDARPPDLSCADDPEPTGEVPETVTLNGQVQQVVIQGTMPSIVAAVDVAVEARARATDEAMVAGTSDSLGEYGVAVTTGGAPVDAYLAFTKPSYIPTYLFAADPLRANGAVPDTILLPTLLFQFAPQLGIDLQEGDGIAAVRVVDCEGIGIPGVQPTIVGGDDDTQVIDGSIFLPGTFLVINIPIVKGAATPVTLQAEYSGTALQDNPIKVFPDSVSFTEVHP
jgi:hypothetical protein